MHESGKAAEQVSRVVGHLCRRVDVARRTAGSGEIGAQASRREVDMVQQVGCSGSGCVRSSASSTALPVVGNDPVAFPEHVRERRDLEEL